MIVSLMLTKLIGLRRRSIGNLGLLIAAWSNPRCIAQSANALKLRREALHLPITDDQRTHHLDCTSVSEGGFGTAALLGTGCWGN